jgi:arylsulfatase A-like enzyme
MASLFTSLAPSAHGIVTGAVTNGHVVQQQVLPASLTTLAESLKHAGYVTIGVPGNLHLGTDWGFAQGFDFYNEADFMSAPRVNRQVVNQLARAFGRDWQTVWKQHKTFLWLHYFDPHDPYEAHEPWISRYAPEFVRARSDFPTGMIMPQIKERYPVPDAALAAHIKPLYESEISFVDEHFRWLSERLNLAGDNVLLIVTADHGEEIVDHGSLGHAHSLYEELIRIPLLVRWPATLPSGQRIDTPVSLLDVYPTLLDLVGAHAPPALQGESLVPLLRGQARQPPRALFYELHPPRPALKAVRDGEWKLIRDEGTGKNSRLFNLTSDPRELNDVAAEHGDVVARLEAALNGWLSALPAPPADLKTAPLQNESVKERLRALGYVN